MKYSIIYADPPWKFSNRRTGGSMTSGSEAQYKSVMSVEDLFAMPVKDICAPDCVLCMWWVGTHAVEAQMVAKVWGFQVVTMTGFVWNKLTKKNALPCFGMGKWTRAGAECCLIATRGKPERVSASVYSVVTAKVRKHSQKPDEVRERIVKLCGDLPRLEMFGRAGGAGWDIWGNEIAEENQANVVNPW